MHRSIRIGVAALGITALAAVPAAAIQLFGSEDATGDNIHRIDPSTGVPFLVGPAGQDLSFTGMAFDTSTGTLYVSDVTSPTTPFAWGLGRVDIFTGAVTYIGDHVSTTDIHGLAYDSANDVLYGADTEGPNLSTIDRATGAATAVGSFGSVSSIRGLAYDPVGDVLYGVDNTNLYTINRATGAATVVGPHGVTTDTFAVGLEYDALAGILYATFSNGGGGAPEAPPPSNAARSEAPAGGAGQTTSFYTIDPATGGATLVADTGIVRIDGLAGIPTAATWVEIPTLGAAGLAALVAALGAAGFVALRRRRAA